MLKLLASYAFRDRKRRQQPLPARRRTGRPGGAREGAHPAHERAGRLRPDQFRPRRGAADEHRRPADPVRRPGEGGDGALVVRAIQPDAPGVPRSADGKHRHRPEHDRGEHANGRFAQAIADRSPPNCKAGRRNCSRPTRSWRKKRGSSPSRTRRWNGRTAKSNRRGRRWKKRRSSSRSRPSTRASSSRTCRTSCARR